LLFGSIDLSGGVGQQLPAMAELSALNPLVLFGTNQDRLSQVSIQGFL